MAERTRGVGKCAKDHLGSYGYPTRPDHPYGFCTQCGGSMVWECPQCAANLPEDPDELKVARFCRECGTAYFGETMEPALHVVSDRDETGPNAEMAG